MSPSLREYDLGKGSEIIERALGTYWCIEKDELQFRITFHDNPLSRKGMLSTISSVYDPPGLAAPFVLDGRKILQEIVHEKKSWEDSVSDYHRSCWGNWKLKLAKLEDTCIGRCVKPFDLGNMVSKTYHHFSDASGIGYRTASYIRQGNEDGRINVAILMGKSRVSPMHATIPRLELTP